MLASGLLGLASAKSGAESQAAIADRIKALVDEAPVPSGEPCTDKAGER